MTAPALAVYIQGQGVISADNLNSFEQTTDLVNDLRSITGVQGLQIAVRGTTSIGDGGAGPFYWNATSTGTDDNATIIVPNGSIMGAWIRIAYFSPQINTAGGTAIYGTRTAFAAAGIASIVTTAIIGAYATPGDGGGATYYKLAQRPTLPNAGNIQTADGAWWQIVGDEIDARAFGAVAGATSDAYATMLAADIACAAATATLLIAAPFLMGTSYVFTAPVRFIPADGLLKAGVGVTFAFGAGFEAPLDARILDFTANGSGISAQVVARVLTPQMFGAVGNSPSTDDGPALVTTWNAHVASGVPMALPPTKFYANPGLVFDTGARSYTGTFLSGMAGTSSEIAFNAGAASPCLKISSVTGPLSGGQRACFYGEHKDFQISGIPTQANGRILQYGEGNVLSDGNTSVYFNGQKIRNVVVRNNNAPGGAPSGCITALMSGMTDCDVDMTCNATIGSNGLPAYDGSIALLIQHAAFTRWAGSCGNANYGIYLGAGPIYANKFETFDLEVLKIGFYCNAQYAQNNKYHGTFASMDYCIDAIANSGGLVFDNCQFGGIGTTFQITGSISGTTLTVTAAPGGATPINPGSILLTPSTAAAGSIVSAGTYVLAQTSGTTGGVGTYTVSVSQTCAATTITATYGSIIQNWAYTDGTFGGYGVTLTQPQTELVGLPYFGAVPLNFSIAPTTPTTLTAGTWYRNVYGQDAFVSIYASTTGGIIDVRDWFDTASTNGFQRIYNNAPLNAVFPLLAGQSFRLTGTPGATTCAWYRGM